MIVLVQDILIVNVYFPVCSSSDSYSTQMIDILASISNVLDQYQGFKVILGGDFNLSFNHKSVGLMLLKEFMKTYNLHNCDSYFTDADPKAYTYKHTSRECSSFIDHFLISKTMISSVGECVVWDSGDNLYDHLPVLISVAYCPVVVTKSNKKPAKQVKLRWDKADLDAYYHETWQRLNSINLTVADSDITAQGTSGYLTEIDMYCAQIVEALIGATEGIVPMTSSDFFKHWWDDELRNLKQKSMDAHQLWTACCKPKMEIYSGLSNSVKYSTNLQ